jgi:hypothetical protein
MKYVMFKKEMDGMTHYVPIIFPNSLVHDMVAAAVMAMVIPDYTVASAGECNANLGAKCYGRSSTLDIDSDPERDSHIVAMNDYGAGFE